jgi:hypothetical protein
MRRILVTLLLALATLGLTAVTASSAQADERRCYTPHVAGFDTIESCIWLPELSS